MGWNERLEGDHGKHSWLTWARKLPTVLFSVPLFGVQWATVTHSREREKCGLVGSESLCVQDWQLLLPFGHCSTS